MDVNIKYFMCVEFFEVLFLGRVIFSGYGNTSLSLSSGCDVLLNANDDEGLGSTGETSSFGIIEELILGTFGEETILSRDVVSSLSTGEEASFGIEAEAHWVQMKQRQHLIQMLMLL